MKLFAEETNYTVAQKILDVVPLVMRTIRTQMRRHRQAGLSVPQFRALNFISRHEEPSLSAIAEHLGLALPSASKLIAALVAKGLVTRSDDRRDRRRLTLSLTPAGEEVLASARAATLSYLAEVLAPLPPEGRQQIAAAMEILRDVFGGPIPPVRGDLSCPLSPPRD